MRGQRSLSVDKVQHGETLNLRIHADYTNLGAEEAFRELVQNWRDQCASHEVIRETDIAQCIKEEVITNGVNKAIIFRFFSLPASEKHPNRVSRCLGFIRYLGTHGSGTVELVNYNSTLQPWNFYMGGSTKRNDINSVGTHGEGLNIAALALLRSRENHGLRCFSGGLEWDIDLTDEGTLGVTWKKIYCIPEGVSSSQSLGALSTDPKKDTCFILGEAGRRGRDENGEQIARTSVSEEAFGTWLGVALFLQSVPRQNVYTTPCGELLVSHSTPGKLYLRGFQLSEPSVGSASLSGKPLKFSYNYFQGRTNRERAHVADAKEEAQLNCLIWDSVLRENHEMVVELHTMLMSTDPEYGDMNMLAITSTRYMAIAILHHLRELHPNSWFFSETEARDSQIFNAIASFGLEPHALPAPVHAMLRRHRLINSTAEENRERLQNGQVIQPMDMIDEPFTRDLFRILDHFSTFCSSMHRAEIGIIRSEIAQKKLHCPNPRANPSFVIHERWFSKTHVATDLGVKLRDHPQAVFCVASILISDMIGRLDLRDLNHSVVDVNPSRKKDWMVRWRQVEEIEQLHIATSAKPVTIESDSIFENGLLVKFEVPMAWRLNAADPATAKVVLQVHHVETCHQKRWYATDFSDYDRLRDCSELCQEIQGDGNVTEVSLSVDSDEDFFAILGNLNNAKSIPLVGLGSATPHQGPVQSQHTPRAGPPSLKSMKRLLDILQTPQKRVKMEPVRDEDDC
ncbi:hypothetical protein F5X68DRAFT_265896 [Plectosphaerella plurivora]|uniref:Uncharacterized protein n=1 Tax=Plectosphaerella plurivora TaxID=936078 RepID=A0A9P8V0X5_9PEZI|nr:hypothetical protein F5X68DRAFT_265896 [Plectosphaerella plurivora]